VIIFLEEPYDNDGRWFMAARQKVYPSIYIYIKASTIMQKIWRQHIAR
jgi:hypothetical protein